MIYYFTPYSLDKNIGKVYNHYASLVPGDDDWIFFLDGDMIFLTPDWGHQIDRFINKNKDAGIITCYTNRVGWRQQRFNGEMSDNTDISLHHNIAMMLRDHQYLKSKFLSVGCGAYFFGFKKSTWNEIKFDENIGILGVDSDFSERVLKSGRTIVLMCGLYVFHYYRLLEGRKNKKHLKLDNGKLYMNGARYEK